MLDGICRGLERRGPGSADEEVGGFDPFGRVVCGSPSAERGALRRGKSVRFPIEKCRFLNRIQIVFVRHCWQKNEEMRSERGFGCWLWLCSLDVHFCSENLPSLFLVRMSTLSIGVVSSPAVKAKKKKSKLKPLTCSRLHVIRLRFCLVISPRCLARSKKSISSLYCSVSLAIYLFLSLFSFSFYRKRNQKAFKGVSVFLSHFIDFFFSDLAMNDVS